MSCSILGNQPREIPRYFSGNVMKYLGGKLKMGKPSIHLGKCCVVSWESSTRKITFRTVKLNYFSVFGYKKSFEFVFLTSIYFSTFIPLAADLIILQNLARIPLMTTLPVSQFLDFSMCQGMKA